MSVFAIENGQVLVVSDTGKLQFVCNPFEWPVMKLMQLNERAAIVVLDYYRWDLTKGFNLACIDDNGHVLWRAFKEGSISSDDLIVDVTQGVNGVSVNTWSGYRFSLDARNGSLSLADYVK